MTTQPARILVVEDDRKTAATIVMYLDDNGFATAIARDGPSALQYCREHSPDLVLLDLMLPGLDGFSVCESLQRAGEAAVILLTARAGEDDKLRALDMGADDYITKPFSPRELVARIRAVLRRTKPTFGSRKGVLHFEGIAIDLAARTVDVEGRDLTLTRTEFDILACLARAPQVVFSRAELVERALGWEYDGMERTVDVHVMNLRKKLASRSARQFVTTVFGVGYKFQGSIAS